MLDALLVRADRLLAADRLHAGALAVRTLLGGDRDPADSREDLFAQVRALKAIARGAGPLAANAFLRLHDLCALALADAATAPPGERGERIATCLYPLHDANPAPYFAADRAQRRRRRRGRISPRGRARWPRSSGKSPAARATRPAARRRRRRGPRPSGQVPPETPIRSRSGCAVTAAEPYEHTPLLALGNGQGGFEPHAKPLAEALARDGRGRVAVALSDDARAEVLIDVAQRSQRLGATVLELAVARSVRLRPVAGDYWQTRAAANPEVVHVAVIPLALADLALRSDQPRGPAGIRRGPP